MKPLYSTGFTNYQTHDEASRNFYRLESPVALELHRAGHAYIVWLSDKPTQNGQVAFIGTNPKYNEAAIKLREG